MADTSAQLGPTSSRPLLQSLLNDRLLLSAFVCCVLLIAYQLSVTLLQPPWIKPATNWLRAALAWPQLLIVAWFAIRLLRTSRPGAAVWCCAALGMLSYAVARTTWTIADEVIYPHGVPFPSFPDLFFILQYPFFIVALFLATTEGRSLPGARTMFDGLLWMSAVTALTWYFVLRPIALQTGEPRLSRNISIYYQIADLVLFYGLVAAIIRLHRTTREVLVMSLLSLAVASLFVADTWAAVLLLYSPHTYRTGNAPDLFWFTCYLLIPLASLVRLRVTSGELPPRPPPSAVSYTWRDVLAFLQFVSPNVVVVVASLVIIVYALVVSPSPTSLSASVEIVIALLVLATLRPGLVFLEHEQLRRARDAARAQQSAMRLAKERMEAFLSMVAHELRTPLTILTGNMQLMTHRLEILLGSDGSHEDYVRTARLLATQLEQCDHSLQRLGRLAEDVLDETYMRRGQFALRLEPSNLAGVVGKAVAELRMLNPDRSIRWVSEVSAVPVMADASRIEQVVANYVSNALKFSQGDQAVDVHLRREDGEPRVSVHDEGVGIPLAEQPHIWEPFYQAESVEVRTGSQVGFGLGLFISKTIIEGHHGQVGIESAPGQGTTLWFTLPLSSPLVSTSSEAGLGSPASPPGPGEHEQRNW